MLLTMALSKGRNIYPPTPNLHHLRVVPVWGTFYNLGESPMAGSEGSPGLRGEPTHVCGTVHGHSAETRRRGGICYSPSLDRSHLHVPRIMSTPSLNVQGGSWPDSNRRLEPEGFVEDSYFCRCSWP